MKKPILLLIPIYLIAIFTNSALAQTQMGLDIDGEAAGDESGWSVSTSSDGNTVAIGARFNTGNGIDAGHVRVYFWNGAAWVQKGTDIEAESQGDYSGSSVSMSSNGSTVAIGAILNEGTGTVAGHARIYYWNGSSWVQKGQDLDGVSSTDFFGYSVSIDSDGGTVAIAATIADGDVNNSGQVDVYEWNGALWSQKGESIVGEAFGDRFGRSTSISLNGNTVAIGAPYNDGNGNNSGHVQVYDWTGFSWIQKGMDIDGGEIEEMAGFCVSMDSYGNTVAVGAPSNDINGTNSGRVRVYDWNGTSWIQKGEDIYGEVTQDLFGEAISMSSNGDVIAIGASRNDGSNTDAGSVRVYYWTGASWVQYCIDIYGEEIGDLSGYAVSMSLDASIIAIGAYRNDGNGIDAGHVRMYSLPSFAGLENHDKIRLNIYPNPTTGAVQIGFPEPLVGQRIVLTSALGQILESRIITSVLMDYDISSLSNGVYFIRVQTSRGMMSEKLLKE